MLAGAAALARPALGLVANTAEADVAAALHGLYWLTTALSEHRPVLLSVDDAQWGDVDSLRYLAYMSERVADLPLLLVVTVRARQSSDVALHALRFAAGTHRLELEPLSPPAGAQLVRTALSPDSSDEFCAACHTATGGNPFILHELVAQLRRDRVAPTAQNALEVARVTPDSVKRSVLLRLSTLGSAATQLASGLAVLGGQSRLVEAARVSGFAPDTAAAAADALIAAGIVAPGSQLTFVHPLVREVIYHELPEHERRERHRAAAGILADLNHEPERVAAQLIQAAPNADAWVIDHLREAARAALAEGAPQPAVEFLARALEEPPDKAQRVTVLRELGRAEARGASPSAIGHLQEAFAASQDPREQSAIGLELMAMLARHGQMERAVELAYRVLASIPAEERALELAVIASGVTGAILVPALHPHVDYFLERIPVDLPGQTREERMALSARLAVALTRGARMDEVADLAGRTLQGGGLLDDLPSHELLYWNAASALVVADAFEPARVAIDAAFDDARRHGSIVGFALSSCFRCLLDYRVGDVAEGVVDGRQALDASAPAELQVRAYAVAFLADCLIDSGELETALTLTTAPEFTGELPEVFVFHLLRVARARARIESGDAEAGVKELLEVRASMQLGRLSPAVCPWRTRASLGLSLLERRREARELAEEELSLARETASAWGEVVALQALAVAAPEAAEALLEQASEIAEQGGFALERARSLLALGSLRRRLGKRATASQLLRDSFELSGRCGALALEQRARDELAAAGLRPRRRPLTGAESLTPAERRVAQMAAEGASNRAIAQGLFLSLRTVETHLTRTYQKLGIDSRGSARRGTRWRPRRSLIRRTGSRCGCHPGAPSAQSPG